MKVTVNLDQALLSRINAVRTHVHENSIYAAFPEMELPDFLRLLITASVLNYESDFLGLEVSSMTILENLYNTLQETSIFEFIVKTIEEVRESLSDDEEDDDA